MNQNTVTELVVGLRVIGGALGAIGEILEEIQGKLTDAGDANLNGQNGERLPDVPDWRDNANLSGRSDKSDRSDKRRTDGAAQFAADDRLTRIRLTVAMHEGESLAEIIEAILADGIKPAELAGLLGVNQARISEALHGKARPGFVARFAEVLGCDGGAGARTGGPGGLGGHGGQGAGTGVAANCRGKRGTK